MCCICKCESVSIIHVACAVAEIWAANAVGVSASGSHEHSIPKRPYLLHSNAVGPQSAQGKQWLLQSDTYNACLNSSLADLVKPILRLYAAVITALQALV